MDSRDFDPNAFGQEILRFDALKNVIIRVI